MKHMQGDAEGLAKLLQALVPQIEAVAIEGQQQNAEILTKRLNSDQVETPIFVEAAPWTLHKTEDGTVVGNPSQAAIWGERGQPPGPLPHGPIRAWVERNPKVWQERYRELVAKKNGQQGRNNGRYTGFKDEREQAISSTAFAIQTKLEQDGIEPKWTVRRVIEDLKGTFARTLKKALTKVSP